MPTVPSFLPLAIPGMEGPADPAARIDAICASIRRLAAYEPSCVVCLSGPLGGRSEADGRAIVVDGLRRAAATAADAGVRLGFEPIHPAQRDTAGFVTSLADALALLDEAGTAEVGIMADTFNLGHEATDDVVAAAGRFTGLHVADELADPVPGVRALPGDDGRSAEIIGALRTAGWDGTLDVEIFSTPDDFWALPPDVAAREAYASVVRAVASWPTTPSSTTLWDFDDPAGSEQRFQALVERARDGDEPILSEALTQLARAQGLQRRFDDADRTLDDAEAALRPGRRPRPDPARSRARTRGEHRGPPGTRTPPAFREAWELARTAGEDALAVDAAHMLGDRRAGG